MGADLVSENDPDNHRNSGDTPDYGIPSPRPPLDDTIENLPEIGSDDPAWWYDQPRKRGHDRRYWGHVERISGPEADRLRENQAAAIRDLLDWASQQIKKPETDSDDDSGEDGEADDTRA